MADAAATTGRPCNVKRPSALVDVTQLPVKLITPAHFMQGGSNTRVAKYDDVVWNAIVDPTAVQPGDILTTLEGQDYFVSSNDPLLPVGCVKCSGMVTVVRPNPQIKGGGKVGGLTSQPGGDGKYFGLSQDKTADYGESTVGGPCPALTVVKVTRAVDATGLPADAPGPSRWRVYLPLSVFPKGSVEDRDVIVSSLGYRYQVNGAQWTPLGYSVECVRLES